MKRFLMLLVLIPVLAWADEKGVLKYRNFTAQQIADLPENVRRTEVPLMYVFATRTGLSKGSETLFAMYLNQLMYSGVHDYEVAIKQFQRDLRDPQTGILTVSQIDELEKRAQRQKLPTIHFPDTFISHIDEVTAVVQGTFVILDDKIFHPVNHAEISCYRKSGYCRLDQLFLQLPKDGTEGHFRVDALPPEYFDIQRWTEDTIDAVPRNASEACRAMSMTLNFSTKEFFQITRNKAQACEVLGETLPKLPKPRISQIVDGEAIYAEQFGALSQSAFDGLSPEFRTRIDALRAPEVR